MPPPDPTIQFVTPVGSVPSPTPGLTPEQINEIALAKVRSKKILRAVATAKFDGGITAFFAICCLLSVCMGWENLVLGVIFSAVAVNSFRGAKKLKSADITAPGMLAMNQLVLAASIILYSAYSLYQGLHGSSSISGMLGNAGGGGGGGDAGIDMADLSRMIYWALYGTLIVGTILAQGLTAIYYITRKKYVQAYKDQTPAWVIQLQAAGN